MSLVHTLQFITVMLLDFLIYARGRYTMVTEKSLIEAKRHEIPPLGKVICSTCGTALKSPYEGIAIDNGIAYCAHCYQAFLFPHIHNYDTEMPDEVW